MRHEKINGKLLNCDKKWSHLKEKQKIWITSMFRKKYESFVKENKKHPGKIECENILDEVYSCIMEREINIPYKEVKSKFSSELTKYKKVEV